MNYNRGMYILFRACSEIFIHRIYLNDKTPATLFFHFINILILTKFSILKNFL